MLNKAYYLEAMGIQRWLVRSHPAAYYCYRLSSEKQPVAYLVTPALLQTSDEAELMEKIAKATGLNYEASVVSDLPDTGLLKLIHLRHSPAEMIDDPSLKRAVWDALRSALSAFS